MSLLNKKNIAKAKGLFDKNKDKIGPAVSKATGAVDKKTGGKYADKLKKVDVAAAKLATKGDPAANADSPANPTT
jgi:hypothetical protein